MAENNSGWPHHLSKNGEWVRCASNPCKLHANIDTHSIKTADDLRNYTDKDGFLTGYNVSDPKEMERLDAMMYENIMNSSDKYIGMSNRSDASMRAPYENWKNLADRTPSHLDLNTPYYDAALTSATTPVYQKTAKVSARRLEHDEEIVTQLAGKDTPETKQLAKAGMYVVTNPGGEEYAVDANKFESKYDDIGDGRFQAKGFVRAIKNPTGKDIEITAPWGEKMHGDKDCMIAVQCDKDGNLTGDGTDRYIIGGKEFKDTYGSSSEPSKAVSMRALQNRISKASFENASASSSNNHVDVNKFVNTHVDKKTGMFTNMNREAMHNASLMSTAKLSDNDQKTLINNAMNKEYMNKALSRVDYNELPAATESLNYLASNPSTSSESIHDVVNIAVDNKKNANFSKQVYISDIANHPNLSERDAVKLYQSYPEETIKAQHCPASIVNKAITDPSTPERIRALALTNPQADKNAVMDALKNGDSVTKAQAMLNPSGVYLNAVNSGSLFDSSENEKPFTQEEMNAATRALNRFKSKSGSSGLDSLNS